jgi:DNA-binding IclR family transcriptional regulator
MSPEGQDTIGATVKTFRIVEGLKELNGAGISELANHLDMPKSSVHNYLHTLEDLGYVDCLEGEYCVGLRFLDLGGYVRNHCEIFDAAKDEADTLAEETGELVNVLVEEHGYGVHIYRAAGTHAVPIDTRIGKHTALSTTALGKAILAHLPEDRVDEIVDRHGLPQPTPNAIGDRQTLFEQLETIRERGYARDDEERLNGIRCVAAPVQTADGEVLGAVSVAGPTHRMKGDRFDRELPDRVLQASNVIELNVTYS